MSNQKLADTDPHAAVSSVFKPQIDRFGIKILYPTKTGGQEWYMNMLDPTSDGRFNPQRVITKNEDGSWKMRSNQVRMYVYTSHGYNTRQITTAQGGQGEEVSKGYMGSPNDWKNVEMTGYIKLNKFSENDNFVWYARGGKHTDSDHCQGSAYKGNLFYLGQTQFSKEQWHVSYAKSPSVAASQPIDGKWTGFKFVVYNYLQQNGKAAVKMENWIDRVGNGKDWVKVYEGADAGAWGRSGSNCQVSPDQIITWGGPIATFRWDFASDVDFKDLSVREISADNGTTNGIVHFHGSSKSSGVPRFGNFDGEIFSGTTHPQDRVITGGKLNSGVLSSKINMSNPDTTSLSENTGDGIESSSFGQQTIVKGDNVYTLWSAGDEDDTDVYLSVSNNRGVTFGKTFSLSNNPASLSYNAHMVVSGNYIYVVWEDDEGNSDNTDIFFIRSSDGGKSFGNKINLSNDPSGSGDPRIVVFGNKVHIAWTGTSPDNTGISFVESSDDGTSFTQPKNIGTNSKLLFDPSFIQDGNKLYVNWSGDQEEGYKDAVAFSNIIPKINETEIERQNFTLVNDTKLVEKPQSAEPLANMSPNSTITDYNRKLPMAKLNSTNLEIVSNLASSTHSVNIRQANADTPPLMTNQNKSLFIDYPSPDESSYHLTNNKENISEQQTAHSSLQEIINRAQSRVTEYDSGNHYKNNNGIHNDIGSIKNYDGLKNQTQPKSVKVEEDTKDLANKVNKQRRAEKEEIQSSPLDESGPSRLRIGTGSDHDQFVKSKQDKLVQGQERRGQLNERENTNINSAGADISSSMSQSAKRYKLDKIEQIHSSIQSLNDKRKSNVTPQEESSGLQVIQTKIRSAFNMAQDLAAQSTLVNIRLEKAIKDKIPIQEIDDLVKDAKFASQRAKTALNYYNQLRATYSGLT